MRVDRSATRSPRHAFGLAVVVVALVAVAVLAPLGVLGALRPGALMLLPALVLAAALLAGRYPGERLIERWGRARPRIRPAVVRVLVPIRRSRERPHGGRLIATALAGRAPPAFAAG
jgi:hypothetical protein